MGQYVRTLMKAHPVAQQAALGLYDLIVTGQLGEPKTASKEKFMQAFREVTQKPVATWEQLIDESNQMNIVTAQLLYTNILKSMYATTFDDAGMSYTMGLWLDFGIESRSANSGFDPFLQRCIYTDSDTYGNRYTLISDELANCTSFARHETPYLEDLSYIRSFVFEADLREKEYEDYEEVNQFGKSLVEHYLSQYGAESLKLPPMYWNREGLDSASQSLRAMAYHCPDVQVPDSAYPLMFGMDKKSALVTALNQQDIQSVIYLMDQGIEFSETELTDLKQQFETILSQPKPDHKIELTDLETLKIAETFIAHVTLLSMDENNKAKDELKVLASELKAALKRLYDAPDNTTAKQFVQQCQDKIKEHRQAIFDNTRLYRYAMNFLWSLTIVGGAINAGYAVYTSLAKGRAGLFFAQPEKAEEFDNLSKNLTQLGIKAK